MLDSEFVEKYTIHRMVGTETVAAFDCGDNDLNDFILTDAPLYRKEKLAVTLYSKKRQIVLSPSSVSRTTVFQYPISTTKQNTTTSAAVSTITNG